MKPINDRLSPKQLEDILQISKSQLHHWEKLLDLTPVERSYGRGLATVYSRENLFVLLLLQRLFQNFGFTLSAAGVVVQRLLRDVGLERLQQLSSVTITTSIAAEQQRAPKRRCSPSVLHRPQIRKDRPAIVGSITIPLKDLQEAAHGSVN
jgi:DNA-binding transcriptional MerR regulator